MGVAIPLGFVEDRASGALVVDGGLRFDGSKSHYLTRTPAVAGNRIIFTLSFWLKLNSLTGAGGAGHSNLYMGGNGTNDNEFFNPLILAGGTGINVGAYNFSIATTNAYFRDISAWYHIVIAVDTTQSAQIDKLKVYQNGVLLTFTGAVSSSFTTTFLTGVNNATPQFIGELGTSAGLLRYYPYAQFSQYYLIDGQALTPSSFGYTDALTNTWRPKKYISTLRRLNDGTTWNSTYANAFLGYVMTDSALVGSYCGLNNSTGITITLSSSVTVTSSLRLNLYASVASFATYTLISVNGTSQTANMTLIQSTGTNSGTWEVSGFTGTLTSITLGAQNGANNGISRVIVDGVTLINDINDANGFGRNGFYLPFDGSAPIGQDQSGRGNNWTPVNFGGSNTLEKATGALPILNTDGGGKVARVGVRTDSSASSLVLALPLVGIKSDFSNAVNSGTSNKAVTATNAVASSAQSNFYGGSFYFDGDGDYLSIPQTSDLDQNTDFTVEYWIYINSQGGSQYITPFGGDTNYYTVQFHPGQVPYIVRYAASTVASGGKISLQKWCHVALTKSGNTLRCFVDGILQCSGDEVASPTLSGAFNIGRNGATYTNYFDGYMSDFRFYKGLAKYTQNFIPASTDPDILPDTPSGVSYTSNLTQITDGAVALDGSGDYLELPYSSDLDFTGQFTLEAFVYPNASTGDYSVFGNFLANATGNWGLAFDYSTYGVFTSFYYNGNTQVGNSGYVPIPRAWNHYAVTRDASNVIRVFLNGQLLPTTATYSGTLGVSAQSTFIGLRGGLNALNGTISNVHWVKGTCLYTSNFTPPTAGISSVANTKLLCCQSNSNPKLSPVGPNVGLSTSTRFNTNFETIPTTVNGISVTNNGSVSTTSAGTNSFGFTNGANFTGSNSLTANLGTVPALSTIDLIFKVNGTTDNKYLFGMGANGIVRRSSSNLAWYNGSADQTVYTSPDDGAWHHLRVTPTDLYFDGTRIQNTGSLANINNEGVAGNNPGLMAIGAYRDSGSGILYNGAVIFGLVRVMPGVDLGAPTVPITTNGSLSGSETIPTDGIIIRNGNAAATNFNPFTVNINTQRGKQSGYCTLNPLDSALTSLSDGNLNSGTAGAASWKHCRSTVSITSGKYYWEYVVPGTPDGSNGYQCGYALPTMTLTQNINSDATGYYGRQSTVKYSGSGSPTTPFTSAGTAGDILSFAFDADAGKLYTAKNGIYEEGKNPAIGDANWTSVPTGGAPMAGSYGSSLFMKVNFGQKPFKFPPPAGFQPLALANTPRPTIVRPDQFVGVTTYTGTGAARSINTGFKPDFVWLKSRSSGSYSHNLYDAVRGATKILYSDSTSSENTDANGLTAFNSDGFSLGSTAATNESSTTYVAWAWKAGGNSNTFNINDVGYATASAAGLTAGTITPTGASVNTKSGFSIIKYRTSGSGTVPHGLTQAPQVSIAKRMNGTSGWYFRINIGSINGYLFLNGTDALGGSGSFSVTSTTVQGADFGSANEDWILYNWHEVPGFSKFGTYTGNGSTDGPMVVAGFKVKWLMCKRSNSTGNWVLVDGVRRTYNVIDTNLYPNGNYVEDNSFQIDSLSNGFKIRSSGTDGNASGGTYIYMAFAETPTQNLYGAQSNAR
jgi:hypothetical protein